mmetsp:Transcript_30526/g.97640  ORF Transcript_30526/g.97640 Transcript_30526/m.97640 type:complete len:249 (+) Transcript_30526:701-1447(+)
MPTPHERTTPRSLKQRQCCTPHATATIGSATTKLRCSMPMQERVWPSSSPPLALLPRDSPRPHENTSPMSDTARVQCGPAATATKRLSDSGHMGEVAGDTTSGLATSVRACPCPSIAEHGSSSSSSSSSSGGAVRELLPQVRTRPVGLRKTECERAAASTCDRRKQCRRALHSSSLAPAGDIAIRPGQGRQVSADSCMRRRSIGAGTRSASCSRSACSTIGCCACALTRAPPKHRHVCAAAARAKTGS